MMKFKVTRIWHTYKWENGRNIPVRHSVTKIEEAKSADEIKKKAVCAIWVEKI